MKNIVNNSYYESFLEVLAKFLFEINSLIKHLRAEKLPKILQNS